MDHEKDTKIQKLDIGDCLFELDGVFGGECEFNSDFDDDSESPAEGYFNVDLLRDEPGISGTNMYKHRTLSLAILGKPNAGKSTFINRLLNEERCVVDAEAGTTRDSVDIKLTYKGKKIQLVDTAGISVRSRKKDHTERMIHDKTIDALRKCQVAVVLIDSLDAFHRFDFDLALKAAEEGKCLVLVVNKWDLVVEEWKEKAARFMMKQIKTCFGEVRGVPLHFVSSSDGTRVFNV